MTILERFVLFCHVGPHWPHVPITAPVAARVPSNDLSFLRRLVDVHAVAGKAETVSNTSCGIFAKNYPPLTSSVTMYLPQ